MLVHPGDCPAWDYEAHDDSAPKVWNRSIDFLSDLKRNPLKHQPLLSDCRPRHKIFFHDLTPAYCDYFAGNYRGDNFRCLQCYGVGVGADPMVGCHFSQVLRFLADLNSDTARTLAAIDLVYHDVAAPPSRLEMISYLVPLAAEIVEVFLTIHPFANGNGHMARLLVLVLFARFDIWPQSWTLDLRPPYAGALSEHRRNNVVPLQKLIHQSIDGYI